MALRMRRSLENLQADYLAGNRKELDDLMRAWRAIKALPPTDPNSYFMIAGYHGEPFRGPGATDPKFWGGYCNHGNVLFPTWHRVYLLHLENALRSIPGCENVTMPFWDQTSAQSRINGIPWALTDDTYVLDGEEISNPLKSFILNREIVDQLSPDPAADYSKPLGYETVRYPMSGLVGTDADRANTASHNAQFRDNAWNVRLLNANITDWLNATVAIGGKQIPIHVADKYARCLEAPNYTVFSNSTSAVAWFKKYQTRVTAVEGPHDAIHLAIGGYDLPTKPNEVASPIAGANADMGENDTSSFDPIFFFHHAFIDRMFWLWQLKQGMTKSFDIIPQFPGTNSANPIQGPTPGVPIDSWLTMDSALDPFRLETPTGERAYTSRDCIDIEGQLGYTYGDGSIPRLQVSQAAPTMSTQTVRVTGVNRAGIRGSFLISAFATIDGERRLIGSKAVLSRWNVEGCANCQTHLDVTALFGLLDNKAAAVSEADIDVEISTRRSGAHAPAAAREFVSAAATKRLKVEII